MKVLLSIKPEFVEKIFEGTKKFEFRKALFKREDVNSVIIYATVPVKRIVGEFSIKRIISDDVNTLWLKTKDFSGISEDFYFSYFQGQESANAIEIDKTIKYKKPKLLSDYNIDHAPQSFCYIPEKK